MAESEDIPVVQTAHLNGTGSDTEEAVLSSDDQVVIPSEAGEPAMIDTPKNKEEEPTVLDPIDTPICVKEEPTELDNGEESTKVDEPMDILGNGKLIKKILQVGKGRETRPNQGEKITVNFSAKLLDGSIVEKDDTLTLVLGDGDFLQAFDLSVALMQQDEIAEVTAASDYTYGEQGRKPDIPQNATLVYTIHLVQVHGMMDYAKMALEERIVEADKKRERGNFHYTRGENMGAINSYLKALNVLDDSDESHSETPAELQKLVDMRMKCYNNLAASQLKIKLFDACVKSCDHVLRVQPANVKALFRKGKALTSQGDMNEAIATLKKAIKLDPENKAIHTELSKLTTKKKQHDEKERAMYQRMLGQTGDKRKKAKDASGWSNWAWAAGAAGAAIAVSVGFTVYRYFHS